ncbi:MAG: ArsA family ATPase [Methylocystaceae bacterium]
MSKLTHLVNTEQGQKFLFFGGKGGVGKTTMAAATAVWLADNGHRTTIVSTDPTVSLSAIFHQNISAVEKTKINTVPNLFAININPSEATGVFQTRLSNTLSGFNGAMGSDLISTPCAEEMAAFDQFVQFIDSNDSDIIVFDTAPTGHSLRELAMPFDWANFLKKQVEQRKELSKLLRLEDDAEALEQLEAEKNRYDRAMETLKDADKTVFTLVLLAAYLPIEETSSAIKDLHTLGVPVQNFIINQLIPQEAIRGNSFLQNRYQIQEKYLQEIGERFGHGFLYELPLLSSDVYDVATLRTIGKNLYNKGVDA